MTAVVHQRAPSMPRRVVNIFIRPYDEWGVITNEAASVKGLLLPYALVVSAIVPLLAFAEQMVTFKPAPDFSWPIFVAGTLLGLASVWFINFMTAIVLAIVISQVSHRFGGKGTTVQAYQVAVYAMTIPWLSGITSYIPYIGWFISFALTIYGLYVLYLGLHRLMRIPGPQRLIATVCVLMGQFFLVGVLSILTFLVAGVLIALFSPV